MTSNTFIFDLDGVIINNELIWENAKKDIYKELFGLVIFDKLGSTVGMSMDEIYEKAKQMGSKVSKEKFLEKFYSQATIIYKTATITPGLDRLYLTLKELNFRIGIVSASPQEWIDAAIRRTPLHNNIDLSLSLFDRLDLPPKPAPDGYIEAMKKLGTTPQSTIILEDSNAGIASAKASGAYTIALTQNLVEGYMQQGADKYVDNLNEVNLFVRN